MTIDTVDASAETQEISPVPAAPRRSTATRWVAVLASVASIWAYLWYHYAGDVLDYKDSISHLEIARRTGEAGFGQIGGVWLPLPHLLMMPLAWLNSAYYSGLAGSIISRAAFVVSSVLLYRIVQNLTGSKLAGLVGALVFVANPNVLYMQSTPMTELLLFACLLGLVYGMQRWIQTDDYRYLVLAAVAGFAGTLTRYEAWVLLALQCCVVIVTMLYKKANRKKLEGTFLAFLFIGGLGIVGWAFWDFLSLGNPFYFQDGEYAKPSLWVGSGEQAVNHLAIAFRTYWYAAVDNIGLLPVILMLVGCVVLVVTRRKSLLAVLPVLSLLVFFPFFVMALYKGQRPLHVAQIGGDLYNVRFGLLMVLPAAIILGYLVHVVQQWTKSRVAVGIWIATTAALLATLFGATPVTLAEPQADMTTGYSQHSDAASAYLQANYHGGTVLMQSFGNELVLFKAHVDLSNNLYEGTYKKWQPALHDPQAAHVTWIVMRRSPDDQVYRSLHDAPQLKHYQLMYQNDDYQIYEVA
jgi:hypothetical protein